MAPSHFWHPFCYHMKKIIIFHWVMNHHPIFLTLSIKGRSLLSPDKKSSSFSSLLLSHRPIFLTLSKKDDHFITLLTFIIFKRTIMFITIQKVTILLDYELSSNVFDPLKKDDLFITLLTCIIFIGLWLIIPFLRPSQEKDIYYITKKS